VKIWRATFLAIAFVFVFLAGVGLGEALHDNPDEAGTQTVVRTLNPLPLAPAARSTVTITVSKP
jgi:hypothetical protein